MISCLLSGTGPTSSPRVFSSTFWTFFIKSISCRATCASVMVVVFAPVCTMAICSVIHRGPRKRPLSVGTQNKTWLAAVCRQERKNKKKKKNEFVKYTNYSRFSRSRLKNSHRLLLLLYEISVFLFFFFLLFATSCVCPDDNTHRNTEIFRFPKIKSYFIYPVEYSNIGTNRFTL